MQSLNLSIIIMLTGCCIATPIDVKDNTQLPVTQQIVLTAEEIEFIISVQQTLKAARQRRRCKFHFWKMRTICQN